MATILEDFEDATLNLTITGDWARTQDSAASGSWSLKSLDIDHLGTTEAKVAVPAQATSLTFYYRVSTEPDWDDFYVLIDGVQAFEPLSGNIPWAQATINVTGASEVVFQFTKDDSVNDPLGFDAVWIDNLSFTVPDTGTPKSSTDSAALAEAASVAHVPEVAKTNSDSGRLVEARWTGEPQAAGTPPSVRSTSTGTSGSSSYNVTAPAGVVANDVLLAVQAADRGTTTNMTTPSGGSAWQPLDALDGTSGLGVIQAVRVWWKRAGSSEPTSFVFAQGSGSDGACLIVAIKDASLTAVPKIMRSTDGTGLNVTTPGITPDSGSDLEVRLVAAYALGATMTFISPAGLTPLTRVQSRTYTVLAAAARALQSNAATASANFVASVDEVEWRAGYTLAIAPAVTGPPQETKSASDTGAVVEASAVTVLPDGIPKAASDTGTLSATAAATADISSLDAAALAEAAVIASEQPSADQASLIETSMLTVGWSGADQAVFAETAQVGVQVTTGDSGTLAESVAIAETIGPISSDHALLSEFAALAVATATGDLGALTEVAEVAVLKQASDSAQIVELVALSLASADSATLVETVQGEAAITAGDIAFIDDQAVIEAPRSATDAAVLVETATVTSLGRDVTGLGPIYRRWSAGSPYRRYSAGEPRRDWGAGSPRT
ncbi:hypothetical protein HD597_006760 [Nonomuraea thailandensis]|uniref:Uncharacterized protein n=1 Tax=Nonomuraea thailandensis TaxID=1188745 RepID=A0A9X2K4U8_9ACTN|nr:hypothetical protein [Nonomuraea thailandensis]MCP2359740.1 hypothetical protein [Nonomuraea thailandensis]